MTDAAQGPAPSGLDATPFTPELDPVAGKTVAEVLGEVVWLMTQDPAWRDRPLSEVERLVMPAILLRQFHIQYVSSPPEVSPRVVQPVRAELWALCSDVIAAHLNANPDAHMTLADWRSGAERRIIATIALPTMGRAR